MSETKKNRPATGGSALDLESLWHRLPRIWAATDEKPGQGWMGLDKDRGSPAVFQHPKAPVVPPQKV